jgi:3-deoxy-7-phosphoheptulonate synthase
MIIVLRAGATDEDVRHIEEAIRGKGLTAHISRGVERTIIGAIGDERKLNPDAFEGLPIVEKVLRILVPFKLVSREFSKEDTVITVHGKTVGGKALALFAGPCSVEGRDMMAGIGEHVAPYAFQGLGEEGLKYLAEARDRTGLPVATELMDPRDIDLVARYADVIQIGARNMQNFRLLTEVGKLDKPVILKRGMSATIQEWLMSAEYIASEGNQKIILCERGIRTYETATRNTFDVSAIPVVKSLSHLPVIADPSHAAGKVALVEPLAAAAIAAGADGLMIEVHHQPEKALSDGPQSLRPDAFTAMVGRLRKVAGAVGRTL